MFNILLGNIVDIPYGDPSPMTDVLYNPHLLRVSGVCDLLLDDRIRQR